MNENKMGTYPVNKLLLSMAAPMIISMLVGALYNTVDSTMVLALLYVKYVENKEDELNSIENR